MSAAPPGGRAGSGRAEEKRGERENPGGGGEKHNEDYYDMGAAQLPGPGYMRKVNEGVYEKAKLKYDRGMAWNRVAYTPGR